MKTTITLMFVILILFTGCATGPPRPNRAVITLDSEPQGAKVYEENKGYLGTTPYKLSYTLNDHHYTNGALRGTKLTLVYPGACVEEYNPKLRINPSYRPITGLRSSGGKHFNFHKLIIFRSSGQTVVPRYGNHSGNQDITIHNKKDGLDTMNSGLDLLFKLDALSR